MAQPTRQRAPATYDDLRAVPDHPVAPFEALPLDLTLLWNDPASNEAP